ncbi:hypothetical protein BH20ACT23_BH20ACT23_25700 [soil metagenome]
MSARLTRVLVLVAPIVIVPLCISGFVLGSRRDVAFGELEAFSLGEAGFFLSQLTFVLVGVVILIRRPGHPIGSLFCVIAIVASFSTAAGQYVLADYTGKADLPGTAEVAWIGTVTGSFIPVLFTLIVMVFPNGHLLSSRWKWLRWTLIGVTVLMVVQAAMLWPVRSPAFEIEDEIAGSAAAPVIFELVFVGLLIALIGSVASLVARFRRSRGVERLQLKWFTLGAVLAAGGIFAGAAIGVGIDPGLANFIGTSVTAFGAIVLPLSVGAAILRFRLYDIDRIISRTLSYGVLTAILAGSYLLIVLTLQSVLPLKDDSPPIVAVSTLAAVAAFGPLRARIQKNVDRRFNRSRYDAERTIAEFGGRLRSQVEIDGLSRDLVEVVDRTMHPAHVSLWLHLGGAPRRDER